MHTDISIMADGPKINISLIFTFIFVLLLSRMKVWPLSSMHSIWNIMTSCCWRHWSFFIASFGLHNRMNVVTAYGRSVILRERERDMQLEMDAIILIFLIKDLDQYHPIQMLFIFAFWDNIYKFYTGISIDPFLLTSLIYKFSACCESTNWYYTIINPILNRNEFSLWKKKTHTHNRLKD